MMNNKQLAIKLSKLNGISNFNIKLEQYSTDSSFASEILWFAFQHGDVEGKVLADFGCGSGIFGAGALLLGAKFVYFIDIDKKALDICRKNLDFLKFTNYKVILGDISSFNFNVDTVIMNPPFGVHKRKADKIFLETAFEFSDKIYSIHKIESKNFIDKLSKENNFKVINIIEKNFLIKKTYKFHVKKEHSFHAGIWVLKRNV